MSEAYILDAVRTPFGRYGGALAGVRPDDLAASVVSALLERSPGLDPASIDDVLFGDANAAGEDNRNVARMAVLLAGLPTSVPGATVIPGWVIDAVAEAPGGSQPSYSLGVTERDNDFYKFWDGLSRDRDEFSAWMHEHVTGTA